MAESGADNLKQIVGRLDASTSLVATLAGARGSRLTATPESNADVVCPAMKDESYVTRTDRIPQ